MAMKKTYYSVDGEILGERAAGGQRLDYLTDALGNVTATVNQSGQVVNTYKYKPYGALLQKTGSGSDPSFQWVGSQGYRQTGKKYSDVYVRARHHDSTDGRWTTRDPLGRRGKGWNLYRYAFSDPTDYTDRYGLLAMKALYLYCPNVCSECQLAVQWTDIPKKTGWIIQHVKKVPAVTDCKGHPTDPQHGNEANEFWEAWRVVKGKLAKFCDYTSQGIDTFGIEREGLGTKGTIDLTGYVRFVEDKDVMITVPKSWQCPGDAGHVDNAGKLPTTKSDPMIAGKPWLDKGAMFHELKS